MKVSKGDARVCITNLVSDRCPMVTYFPAVALLYCIIYTLHSVSHVAAYYSIAVVLQAQTAIIKAGQVTQLGTGSFNE